MPRLKPEAPPQDPIEKDFLDAIERLQNGNPRTKALKTKASNGSLKINFSTVALEAGRARTLIALNEDCRYPRVRELIKQIKGGRSTLPTTHTELIHNLRFEKAELAAKVKQYQAEAQAHFLARTKAEHEAKREREAASRLRKQLAAAGKIATLVPDADNK